MFTELNFVVTLLILKWYSINTYTATKVWGGRFHHPLKVQQRFSFLRNSAPPAAAGGGGKMASFSPGSDISIIHRRLLLFRHGEFPCYEY